MNASDLLMLFPDIWTFSSLKKKIIGSGCCDSNLRSVDIECMR